MPELSRMSISSSKARDKEPEILGTLAHGNDNTDAGFCLFNLEVYIFYALCWCVIFVLLVAGFCLRFFF